MSLWQRAPQFTRYLLSTPSQTPIARVLVSSYRTQGKADQAITRQTPTNVTRAFHSTHKLAASSQKPDITNSSNKTTNSIASSEAPKPNLKPKREPSPIQLWPFLAILVGGTLLFNQLLKSRAGTQPPKEGTQIASGPLTISK